MRKPQTNILLSNYKNIRHRIPRSMVWFSNSDILSQLIFQFYLFSFISVKQKFFKQIICASIDRECDLFVSFKQRTSLDRPEINCSIVLRRPDDVTGYPWQRGSLYKDIRCNGNGTGRTVIQFVSIERRLASLVILHSSWQSHVLIIRHPSRKSDVHLTLQFYA